MEIIKEVINKDIKKALKGANSVAFRLLENGQSVIEFTKKISVEGFETEVRKSINVGTKKSCYEGGIGSQYQYEFLKGFSHITCSDDDLKWQTVVKNIKIDDEIILEWIAGNGNNIMEEAGITCDTLNLMVRRNDLYILKFHINDSITQKNSIARMINLRKKSL